MYISTGLLNWLNSTRPLQNGWCFMRRLKTLRRRWSWTQTMHDADDIAVLDGTKDGLQESTDLLSHYAAYAGLKINSGKTKTMTASKQLTQRPYTEACTVNIKVDDLWSRAVPVGSYGQFDRRGHGLSNVNTSTKQKNKTLTRVQLSISLEELQLPLPPTKEIYHELFYNNEHQAKSIQKPAWIILYNHVIDYAHLWLPKCFSTLKWRKLTWLSVLWDSWIYSYQTEC